MYSVYTIYVYIYTLGIYICYILYTVQFGDCMLPTFVPTPKTSASIGSKRRRPLANRKLASSNKRCPPGAAEFPNPSVTHPGLRWKNLLKVESPMRNDNIMGIKKNVSVFFNCFYLFRRHQAELKALQRTNNPNQKKHTISEAPEISDHSACRDGEAIQMQVNSS